MSEPAPAPPCTCGHDANIHTGLAGCLESWPDDGVTRWCTCARYVGMPVHIRDAVEETKRTLIDLSQARAARDHGTAVAGANSPDADAWRNAAQKAMATWIKAGIQFSANDIRDDVGDPPVPAMMGALFLHYSRLGAIVRDGWLQSPRKAAHARPLAVWRAA